MSAILTVQDLEKSFGPRRVLRGVSFGVHPGDRIGLVGVNGSGKSTLMKMLVAGAGGGGVAEATGDLEPDEGHVTRQRELRLEYVPQEPRLDPDATVAETLDRGPDVPPHEVRGLSAALELPPPDARLGALSLGERRRVALGRALLAQADLLALDEPTNHLDARTIEWLEGRLARRSGALLVVTHDRYFLDRVATRILELDRGRVFGYEGDYTAFLERQAERLANEEDRERARTAFVRRELDWVRRGPKARGTKAKARLDRFHDAVAARPSEEDARTGPLALRLPSGGRLGKKVVELRKLGRTAGEKRLFRDLDLVMKPGDRIGIVGPNGAGKTTLVRTLVGLEEPDEGTVVVGQNTRFSYARQGRGELDDDRTVIEEVADERDFVELEDGPVHVRTFLRMLQFQDASADTRVGSLSGGERNRVQLAKLLRGGGNVVVLDEPTNDLDLMTLSALEDALCAFPGCALIVSHDRWFLDRVATGILAFEGDGRVDFFEGNYSSYKGRRREPADAPGGSANRGRGAATRPAPKPAKPRKLTFNEKRELEGMEGAITLAEERVAELEGTLADPSVFKDRGEEVPDLVAALDAARAEVERLYERWQELEEIATAAPS